MAGRVRSLLAVLLLTAGVLLLGGWVPGAAGMATGPRIGMGMLGATVGVLMLAIPATSAFLRRRARPGDYTGRCPVGESCTACGAFNLKPRQACRTCGAAVNAA